MAQIHNDIRELRERIEKLEARLEETENVFVRRRRRVNRLLKQLRHMIVRMQSVEEGEIQYIGVEFGLGSKLIIPNPPRRLRERLAVETIPRWSRRDLSMVQLRKAFEEEREADGVRRGLHRTE